MVSYQMERKGLVESADVFKVQLKVTKYGDKLKEGTYVLNTSMTPREMMKIMAGEVDDSGDNT